MLAKKNDSSVPLRLTVVLGSLAILGPFSLDTAYPALHNVQTDLHVNDVAVQQTVSLYLLGYAVMSPFHGPISDMFGRRKIVLFGLVAYVLASVGCALSASITQLLLFRLLQGLSAGAGIIVGRAIIRDVIEGSQAQRLMSRVTLVFAIGPAVAPIVGGWIAPRFHWHAIYWFLAILGLAVLIASWFILPESHPVSARMPVRLESLSRTYRKIATNGRFLLLSMVATANFGALVLYITSSPALIIRILGLTPSDFIYFFGPNTAGLIAGSYAGSKLAGRVRPYVVANLGFLACGVATVFNVSYSTFSSSYGLPWAMVPIAVLSFGAALAFPVLTLAMLDMFPAERGSASSLQTFVSQIGCAVIAGVLAPFAAKSAELLACCAAALTVFSLSIWFFVAPKHASLHRTG